MGSLQVRAGPEDPGDAWDTFVAARPTGHLMQSRAWARVRQDTGWQPLYLRLEDSRRIRAAARRNPFAPPWRRRASTAYCEQEGVNRHAPPRSGDRTVR